MPIFRKSAVLFGFVRIGIPAFAGMTAVLVGMIIISTSNVMANSIPGPGPAMMGGGGNLTSLKGSGIGAANAFNNQANAQRTAYVEQAAAEKGVEVTYRNCESMLKRCVMPKCSAGCTDSGLVTSIIQGCLSAMASGCSQFEALPSALSAEIVSMGAAAQQKAAAEAQAQAAAAAQAQAAAQQNNAQVEAMQQQMMQMQQQMASQQAEATAQQQKMMEEMMAAQKAAAAAPAAAPQVIQMAAAAENPAAGAIMAREQASGQIMSEIDRMNGALAALKKALETTLNYAQCDYKGDNCGEVKRVAAFREKAGKFFHPFDEVIDRIYDVISMGQALGADVSNVYMLLENGCAQWGVYIAGPKGGTYAGGGTCNMQGLCTSGTPPNLKVHNTIQRILRSGEEVLAEFAMGTSRSDGMVVGCASSSASATGMFGRRRANASAIDIDPLKDALAVMSRRESVAGSTTIKWINPCCGQSQPTTGEKRICIAGVDQETGNCKQVKDPGSTINPAFALCPVHGLNSEGSCGTESLIMTLDKDLISRRATNITKEMYSQYSKLEIITKQIRTMVQQAVLNHHDERISEASGAASGGAAGGIDPTMCMGSVDPKQNLNCLAEKVAELITHVQGTSVVSSVHKQCGNLMHRVASEVSIHGIVMTGTGVAKDKACASDKNGMMKNLTEMRELLIRASNATSAQKSSGLTLTIGGQ